MTTMEQVHETSAVRNHAISPANRLVADAIRARGKDVPAARTSRPPVALLPLTQAALSAAKRAYTTRRCDFADVHYLLTDGMRPQAGDLVLARVEEIGQHGGLHAITGRRSTLFPGDEIVVAYGNRYAPDQFEAVVPDDLGPCQLAAGGGVAARVTHSHAKMRRATQLQPLGLLADADGQVINLRRYALPQANGPVTRPVTIAVVGTSMNSGKTTTAAHLVRGLRAAGFVVSAAKVTGTGAGGDPWLMRDAGAAEVLDFTDAGHASTYKLAIDELCTCLDRILDHLGAGGTQVAVIEIADGLFQKETAALLSMSSATEYFDLLMFAAQDAMGAAAGVDWLEQRGLNVAAVTGLVTASPLAAREAARAVSLPILKLADLSNARSAGRLYELARQAAAAVSQAASERAA
jgi:hypothetical protein